MPKSPIARKIDALPTLKEGFIAKSIHYKELQVRPNKTPQMYHKPYQMDFKFAKEKIEEEKNSMDGMSLCERCTLIEKCQEEDKDVDNVLVCPRFLKKEKNDDTRHKKNS